jgi:hypothetical protein
VEFDGNQHYQRAAHLPVANLLVIKMIPGPLMNEFREEAQRRAELPTSRSAAMLIIALWITAAAVLNSVFWPTPASSMAVIEDCTSVTCALDRGRCDPAGPLKRATGVDAMIKTILAVLSLTFLPSVAFAQPAAGPGDGTDLYRVNREVEAMRRDGRWQRLLDDASGRKPDVTPSGPSPQPSTTARIGPQALPELRLACQEKSRKLFKGPRRMDPDLYKRVVERRLVYVRDCMDDESQKVEEAAVSRGRPATRSTDAGVLSR